MKKSTGIRIVSYSLALAAVAGGLAVTGFSRAAVYRRQMETVYRAALASLVGDLSRLDGALTKSRYAGSAQLSALLTAEIWKEAASAKASMALLPVEGLELDKTHRLIAQSGAYAYTLLKKNAAGEKLTAEERDRLTQLQQAADALSVQLFSLERALADGDMTLSEAKERFLPEEAVQASGGAGGGDTAGDFPEYASLIYDGPFSDHIERKTVQMLGGAEEVSREAARRRAAEIAGLSPEALRDEGGSEGKIATWRFSGERESGDTVTLELTRRGGFLLNYACGRVAGQPSLSPEKAVEKARAFLSALGMTDMKESWYMTENDVVTVNFAATQGGVICYPDLVKVAVAQDVGEVLSAECYGYLTNHRTRESLTPAVSAEEARAQVAEGLTVLSEGLALIPTSGENEKLCYEFKTRTGQGGYVLVYVDAATGREDSLLLLIEDERGTLTL